MSDSKAQLLPIHYLFDDPEAKSDSRPLPIHPTDDPEADVRFQSVDGTQFLLQRKYIEVNTGAFPSNGGEITHLTENSVVLETLFQFVYPIRYPDLDDMDFNEVTAVAEAAEKYEVFNAMNICRIRMRQFLSSNASGILTYAVKHDYPKLIQESAPLLVRLPMSVVLPQLPSQYTEPWVRYHEAWDAVFEVALKQITEMKVAQPNIFGSQNAQACYDLLLFIIIVDPSNNVALAKPPIAAVCHACLFTMFTIIKNLQSIQSLQDLHVALAEPRVMAENSCLSPPSCQYTSTMTVLCADILAKIKGIPSFSTFLPRT